MMKYIVVVMLLTLPSLVFSDDEQCDNSGLSDLKAITQKLKNSKCKSFDSPMQESAPIQRTGQGKPCAAGSISVQTPAKWTTWVPFEGKANAKASHEGVDYIHTDESVKNVDVISMASGTVVYVRTGCPQTSMFKHNNSKRECGSGWGNHVIIQHENGLYTRYAHMDPNSIGVKVGQTVRKGQKLGFMGNSGRSEKRHLHFELGKGILGADSFDPCGPTKSFETIYDPNMLLKPNHPNSTPSPLVSTPSKPKPTPRPTPKPSTSGPVTTLPMPIDTPEPTPVPTPEPTPKPKPLSRGECISIGSRQISARTGAGSSHPPMFMVDPGTRMRVLGKSNDWISVEVENYGRMYGANHQQTIYIKKSDLKCK